ncbi:MAG TPA: glycosyltransferase [Allosphingosinicella sp.]
MDESAPSPLVTAIVPACDAEAWIGETLRSVAAQSWRDLEILIVDDGSTDGTAAIAEEFCEVEPRARLIRQANGGVAAARNRGLAEARGEWIAPIDSDDLWHPTRIEKMVGAALAAPERPGFVYAWCRTIDGEGRVTGSAPQWAANGRAINRLHYANPVGNGSGLLIDAAAARAAGGYDESLRAEGAWGCEDWLLQMEIAALRPIACVPEYLIGYRVRPDAMSSDGERTHRSWAAAKRRFEARHGRTRCAGGRRHPAMRWFLLAEYRAHRGGWRSVPALIARALRADPARVSLWIAGRSARWARRVAAPGRERAEGPRFEDCPTVGAIGGERHAIGWIERAMERFEARRMRVLERRDGEGAAVRV